MASLGWRGELGGKNKSWLRCARLEQPVWVTWAELCSLCFMQSIFVRQDFQLCLFLPTWRVTWSWSVMRGNMKSMSAFGEWGIEFLHLLKIVFSVSAQLSYGREDLSRKRPWSTSKRCQLPSPWESPLSDFLWTVIPRMVAAASCLDFWMSMGKNEKLARKMCFSPSHLFSSR